MAQGTTRGVPIDTDPLLTADSDLLVPSQKAIKAYADTKGDMKLAFVQTNLGAKTFLDTTFLLRNVANTFNASFTNTNTADRIYTLPDTAGTIALTSNLTGYVPYTGATANLNMGVNKILVPRIEGTLFSSNIQLGSAINIVASYNTYTLQKMSVGSGDMAAMFGVQGSSASTGTAFLVRNSTPTDLFAVLNNGNVGIGIGAPTSKLHVVGASYFTGGHIQLTAGSYFYTESIRSILASDNKIEFGNSLTGISFGVHSASVDGYRWYKASTQLMQLTPNGNLGIGTTNFGSGSHIFTLSVAGNISADRIYSNTFRDAINGNTWVALTGTSPNQLLTIANGGVANVVFANTANVGIGTTTPSQLLHLSSATNTQILLERTGSSAASFAISVGNSRLSIGSSFWLLGNAVGINQQTPTASLHVVGTSASTGSAFLVQNSTPTDLFKVENTGRITLRGNNCYIDYTPTGNIPILFSKFIVGDFSANNLPNSRFSVESNYSYAGSYTNGIGVFSNNSNTGTTMHYFATGTVNNSNGVGTMIGYRANFINSSTTNTWSSVIGVSVGGTLVSTFTIAAGNITGFLFDLTINQVGNTGITKGISLIPTLTATPNYIAIEAISRNNSNDTLIKLSNNTRDVLCVKGDNKIGLFNATPTIQGTTSIAAATYTNNGSIDLDTFDGYTIGQVVVQLRNMGILS